MSPTAWLALAIAVTFFLPAMGALICGIHAWVMSARELREWEKERAGQD